MLIIEEQQNKLIELLNVSRGTIETLREYEKLALKWNGTINLISNLTIKEFWMRHVVDSIQLLQFIENKNICLVDVGSGAGLPGMVLSIAGVENVILIESDSRKAAFLLQASRLSTNKITIINERIENVNLECNILTARALANLTNIVDITKNITVSDKYLFLKGETYLNEINELEKKFRFEYNTYESISSNRGKILEIKHLVEI